MKLEVGSYVIVKARYCDGSLEYLYGKIIDCDGARHRAARFLVKIKNRCNYVCSTGSLTLISKEEFIAHEVLEQ